MKLTEWYPAHIKPVRKGVYQIKFSHKSNIHYSRFSNGIWHLCNSIPEFAEQNTTKSIAMYNGKSFWRGIAK